MLEEGAAEVLNNRILPIRIDDLSVLQSAYMPFLKNGGLFISSGNTFQSDSNLLEKFQLNSRAFLILQLLNETEKLVITSKVAWITPVRTRIGQCSGLGFQFENANSVIKARIESLLVGRIESPNPAQTL